MSKGNLSLNTTLNIYGDNDNWKEIYNKKAVIVSLGAEDFDPESMLDEPILPSISAQNSQSSIPFLKPQIELTLSPPGFASELFEVGGFLHKMFSGDCSFSCTVECLLPFALKTLDLCVSKEKTQFVKLIIRSAKSNSVELDYPGFLLASSNLEECAGVKTLLTLRFERDPEFEKQE